MDEIEEITGCISSCRFFRFSSTNSYSLVLGKKHLQKLDSWVMTFILRIQFCQYLYGEGVANESFENWDGRWFTWRSGEHPGNGASSEPPWNITFESQLKICYVRVNLWPCEKISRSWPVTSNVCIGSLSIPYISWSPEPINEYLVTCQEVVFLRWQVWPDVCIGQVRISWNQSILEM